jgi:hypothetical protein
MSYLKQPQRMHVTADNIHAPSAHSLLLRNSAKYGAMAAAYAAITWCHNLLKMYSSSMCWHQQICYRQDEQRLLEKTHLPFLVHLA